MTPLVTKDFLNDILDADEGVESVNVTLTPREREVLQLLAEGRSVKEIASILDIYAAHGRIPQIQHHGEARLRTTAELTQYAIKHGMVSV